MARINNEGRCGFRPHDWTLVDGILELVLTTTGTCTSLLGAASQNLLGEPSEN